MNDYVTQSGDTTFAKEKWQSLWNAYQFLRSTYDAHGFPQNFGIGHGWVERGPLLPVKSELYQSGLGAEALRALANLAQLAGKDDVSKELTQAFERQLPLVENTFWLPEKNRYAFALDKDNKPVDEASVLATVPMWFGLLDEKNAGQMISQLADSDHQTDWGMRIISNRATRFSGGGYHYGSVWPLFTGWAAVGEYRYHRALPAYQNLRANALLALDGSLGHVTEVLSGDSYQPLSTSSPHQIWSAAMVVSPILRGMLGLYADAKTETLTFAPHVPADWTSFSIRNVRVGNARMNLNYTNGVDSIILEVECIGSTACHVAFEPAVNLRAEVIDADTDHRAIPFHMATNDQDQHVETQLAVRGKSVSTIQVRQNFGIAYNPGLPPLGGHSEGLRILSQSWNSGRDVLTMEVAGRAGHEYELGLFNCRDMTLKSQVVLTSVEGAELFTTDDGEYKARVRIPPSDSLEYSHGKIVFHFSGPRDGKSKQGKPAT
jgi:hypothetical protein